MEVELGGQKSGPAAAHFVTFRDRRIPVIHARKMLAIACTPAPAWPKLLVVRSANGLVGLAVDSIEGTEDLVIKSLGTLLAGHPVISGTSLAVSGEVISILRLAAAFAGQRRRASGNANHSTPNVPATNAVISAAANPLAT